MNLDRTSDMEHFSRLIDLEEEMENIEDELRLAACLMIAFVNPAGRDEDDLCEICEELEDTINEGPYDYSKIHTLLILALAQCQAEGRLTGTPDDAPYHWHLGQLLSEAIQVGALLPEIEAAYEAKIAELAALPKVGS